MTSTAGALRERRGVGLLALVTIGILLASMLMALRPAPTAAVDAAPTPSCLLPLDVVFVLDMSGSMDTSAGGSTRLGEAVEAIGGFVNTLGLPANGGVGGTNLHQVGLLSYADTSATQRIQLSAQASKATIDGVLLGIGPNAGSGNTPLGAGMVGGISNMTAGDRTGLVDGKPVTQVFILLSDGRPWPDPGTADVQRPSDQGIINYLAAADKAYSIMIGTSANVPPPSAFILDPVLMDRLDKPSTDIDGNAFPDDPNFFHVQDASELSGLFQSIVSGLLCGDVRIDKTATPTEVPSTGGLVEYTYDVSHNKPGGLPFSIVTVTDDKCGPVVLDDPDGDDGDGLLEDGETWHFTCSTTILVTTHNKACVGGTYVGSGGMTIPAGLICAEADVTVLPPPDAPSMTIVKGHLPIDPPLGPGGGPVTYTYDVHNNGNVALTNVEVLDFLNGTTTTACDVPAAPASGDAGAPGILDVGETWHYECTTNVTATGLTVNEACVTADLVQSDDSIGEDPTICDKDEVGVPEGSQAGGTGTPAASIPNTSTSLPGFGGPLATLVFGLILVASLGTLAYANVRAARQRR